MASLVLLVQNYYLFIYYTKAKIPLPKKKKRRRRRRSYINSNYQFLKGIYICIYRMDGYMTECL